MEMGIAPGYLANDNLYVFKALLQHGCILIFWKNVLKYTSWLLWLDDKIKYHIHFGYISRYCDNFLVIAIAAASENGISLWKDG